MAFGMVFSASCGKTPADSENNGKNYASEEYDYSAFEDELVMHISGWVSPKPSSASQNWTTDYCTQATYNDIADCGLNAIYGLYEPWGDVINGKNANERALEYAEKAGIKFYLRDFAINAALIEDDESAVHDVFAKYLKYDSFGGALIVDEPSTRQFEEIATMSANWRKYLGDKHFYINLNPAAGSAQQVGINEGETYREHYIRRFIKDTKPAALSYDHYPLLKDGWGEPKMPVDYLLNLEICAEEAQNAGIPLWVFIQSMSYANNTRRPTESEIRWQVLCSMAYGVKGYQYFCYWTPSDASIPEANEAMVAPDGKKTDLWYSAQTVNREVLAWDHVYLSYEWTGTMTVLGEGNAKNKNFTMLEHAFTEHERIKSVKSSQDVIIGTFADSFDNQAFMFVNFSDPGLKTESRIETEFYNASKAVIYKNGERTVEELKNGKLELTLEAGNGAFVIPLQ